MALKILAILAEARTARACLEGALAAAAIEADARIEAFHVNVDPDSLIGSPEEVAVQRLRNRQEGSSDDRAREVRKVFDDWIAGSSAETKSRVGWRERSGAEEELVLSEAEGADLLVLARPHDIDAHDAMHAAIFSAHRPLLVPPDWSAGEHGGIAGRIAIAWKPNEQARRAVEEAAPWLRQAKEVLLVVLAENEKTGGVPEALRLLRDIAVAARTVVIPPTDVEAGEQLLEAAKTLNADALVMGAYRHNALIEWAVGKTTRYVLANAEIPIFLSH
jgi:nucleotide-binding universal stress UspA family protein